MTYQQQTSAYRETEVMSSSPERLIPLLYEHLLVNLRRGAIAIRKKDIEAKYESLSRASDIVHELLAALDFDQGGDIADRLAGLYAFWIKEISAASHHLDVDRVERVAGMVSELHEAWAEVTGTVEAGEPAGAGGGSG